MDISNLEEKMKELSLALEAVKTDSVGSLEISQLEQEVSALTGRSRVSLGLDSGAEITLWPPELLPQVAE